MEEANLILIQMHVRSWFNVFGWQTLNDYLTPQQWTFPLGVRPKTLGLNPNPMIHRPVHACPDLLARAGLPLTVWMMVPRLAVSGTC